MLNQDPCACLESLCLIMDNPCPVSKSWCFNHRNISQQDWTLSRSRFQDLCSNPLNRVNLTWSWSQELLHERIWTMWVASDLEVRAGRVLVHVCAGSTSHVLGILASACEISPDLWLFTELFSIGDKGEAHLSSKPPVDLAQIILMIRAWIEFRCLDHRHGIETWIQLYGSAVNDGFSAAFFLSKRLVECSSHTFRMRSPS